MSSCRFIATFCFTVIVAGLLVGGLATPAGATLVDTQYTSLNGGRADFGSGLHVFGAPSDKASVTIDYTYSLSDDIVIKSRVRGTLYWDSSNAGGCARLKIEHLTFLADNPIVRNGRTVIDFCGPGGNANDAGNQKQIDETFSSTQTEGIRISVNEVLQNGTEVAGATHIVLPPQSRDFPVKINNGTADFGSGSHVFGGPTGDAHVKMEKIFEHLSADVTGTIYYDALAGSGCTRLVLDFKKTDGTVIESDTFNQCGPGGGANNSENKRSIDSSRGGFNDGLWSVRLRVGSVDNNTGGQFVNVVSKSFDFNGPVGTFELAPVHATIGTNQPLAYAFTWTVPEPETWHDLHSLQLRVHDGNETVLWVIWNEAANTFSLFDEATGTVGPGFPAGSAARLETPDATLHLAGATVTAVNSALGIGPASPGVTLNLPLSFKPSAAGRTFHIAVAGTDDLGQDDPFVEVGTVTVAP